MSFEEILAKVRERAANTDVSGIGFLAVQINITGDNGGVFYIEVKDGRVSVEPYEYIDRSCAITISGEDLMSMLAGDFDPVAAFSKGRIKVTGDLGKALEFSNFIKSH